jgi:hypothetical protein
LHETNSAPAAMTKNRRYELKEKRMHGSKRKYALIRMAAQIGQGISGCFKPKPESGI